MCGPLRGLFDPPEAKKSVSRLRVPIWANFWKIDFLTIFDPIWSPRPPILTPLGTKFHGKMSKFRQNTRFWGLRTRETPSTARGSSNEIARGEKNVFPESGGHSWCILAGFWVSGGSNSTQIYRFRGTLVRVCGPLRGLFDHPEAKKSTSRFRRPILTRFGKIDF